MGSEVESKYHTAPYSQYWCIQTYVYDETEVSLHRIIDGEGRILLFNTEAGAANYAKQL